MISIIIPVWGDYKKFLPECLESIEKQTYKDYEIIVVDTETDLPTARNVGIRKAKGDWILCLDVDDMIEPTFLEKTIGKDDIVSVGQKKFGTNDEIWIPLEHPPHEYFYITNQIHCCSLFKKEIWKTVEGFDESLKTGLEDWDFWFQATKAGYTITTIQEPLFLYRQHEQSMVRSIPNHEELKQYIINKL